MAYFLYCIGKSNIPDDFWQSFGSLDEIICDKVENAMKNYKRSLELFPLEFRLKEPEYDLDLENFEDKQDGEGNLDDEVDLTRYMPNLSMCKFPN